MTDTTASPEDVAKLDAAAAEYSQESGIPFEEAREQLANLLKNMVDDPTGTALFFARAELARRAEVTTLTERVADIELRLDNFGVPAAG